MHYSAAAVFLSVFFISSTPLAHAGDDFPAPYNSEPDRDAAPMTASQVAAEMQLPAGFSAHVFAAEPDVQNPIAHTWDTRGRMWVAENFTYAESSQRFDLSLRDRVLILADRDGDGSSDERIVFTDAVQMLTGIEVGRGGVWLMCPPQLLFIPDQDHDDCPDGPAVVMLDGFDVAKENYHNFANGLRWGPDGWLYGRCGGSCPGRIGKPGTPDARRAALEGGIWRYDPRTTRVEVLTHGTTNPWGHDWNSLGECFFVNTVNGHLWHMIPGAHFQRPFTLDPNPRTYALIDMHADHWHFDTGGSWTDSRDGAANDYGGGHAHVGTTIYLGDQWPAEYRDALLTLNMHGRRINRERLTRQGSGYVARHAADMAINPDPFFRGVDLSCGPDGSVYVLDWSDTGECHEHTGVHRTSGRIYRLAYDGPAAPDRAEEGHAEEGSADRGDIADLRSEPTERLVQFQRGSSEWHARQAALVLEQRAAGGEDMSSAVAALAAIADDSDPQIVFRSLVLRHRLEPARQDWLLEMLRHPNESARAWAIRLLTEDWPIDDCYGPLVVTDRQTAAVSAAAAELMPELRRMAIGDPSALVRLTLASTLQRLPLDRRLELALPLAVHGVDAEDHNLPLLVWYGLMPVVDSDPQGLAGLALRCRWPVLQRFIARSLAENLERSTAPLDILIAGLLARPNAPLRLWVLLGIADGLRGWQTAPRPQGWAAMVDQVAAGEDAEGQRVVDELSVLFGQGKKLEELRQTVLDPETDIALRRSALKSLVSRGNVDVRDLCLEVLADPRLNALAAQGLAIYDDPQVAAQLVRAYRRFRGPERPQIISILVSRKSYAGELLDAIDEGAIPAADLTAFDVRQLRTLGDEELNSRVAGLWGEVRETPEDKAARMTEIRELMGHQGNGDADLGQGRRLFAKTCAQCHRMYGEGEKIGPELTGSNRANLDYLLENVVDPSAVVSKDFRMSVILMDDGRVINGLVTAERPRTLTVQTQTELQVVDRTHVEDVRVTGASPMPEGLLDQLTPDQIRDLLGYLMHPTQVPMAPGND